MTKQVFISYAREDKAFATQLEADLEASGLEAWLDIEIIGGDSWRNAIGDAIAASDAMVLCLSPASIASRWVQREIFLAQTLHKQIVPLMLEPCFELMPQSEETRWVLNELQIIMFADRYERALPQLLKALAVDAKTHALRQLFPTSDSAEFRGFVEALVRQAERFVLIGTGLTILHRDPFAKEVIERAAANQLQLEIYLADPTSPAVETRLIEEELGEIKPPVGQLGLFARLDMLLAYWKRLGQPESVSVNLFQHYPTFAMLIVDQDYFVYPYAYARLGNFSPVLHFSSDVPADLPFTEFLEEQYDRVKRDALDARQVLSRRDPAAVNVQDLCSFAFYFVPRATSDFYRFGSEVLGFDVRQQAELASPWAEHVGIARIYGFHLTLCDALYFLNETDVDIVTTELEFLLREFKPFKLTNLEIVPAFPDDRSLAMRFTEPSGSLEALHYEVVHRVYRRAFASNYSLGLSKPVRDNDLQRAELMIKRYNAPYIMQRYRPHFTLMVDVPPDQQDAIHVALQQHYAQQVANDEVVVDKLAIMKRPAPDKPWIIDREITIG